MLNQQSQNRISKSKENTQVRYQKLKLLLKPIIDHTRSSSGSISTLRETVIAPNSAKILLEGKHNGLNFQTIQPV